MSCLFNSLGKHTGESADVVRSKIVDYLSLNPTLLGDIHTNDAIHWESGSSPQSYLRNMRQASTWGGALEISAFSKLYNMNVLVHNIRDSHTQIIRFLNPNARTSVSVTWNGGHYEPVITPSSSQKQ
jgi:hypothetical protein